MQKIESTNVPIYAWTDATEIEDEAVKQLRNVAALPWAFHHVAVMPDVHWGRGCTVGSVVAMKDAIAPPPPFRGPCMPLLPSPPPSTKPEPPREGEDIRHKPDRP